LAPIPRRKSKTRTLENRQGAAPRYGVARKGSTPLRTALSNFFLDGYDRCVGSARRESMGGSGMTRAAGTIAWRLGLMIAAQQWRWEYFGHGGQGVCRIKNLKTEDWTSDCWRDVVSQGRKSKPHAENRRLRHPLRRLRSRLIHVTRVP